MIAAPHPRPGRPELLAERACEQACKFGAEILLGREGVRGEFGTGTGVGHLADGTRIVARATICATGVEYRRLDLPNESRLIRCGSLLRQGASEASLCRSTDDVFVVGGGNSAGQATMHFARVARSVTMVIRGDSLRASLSRYLVDRIMSTTNVHVMTNTEVTTIEGAQIWKGSRSPTFGQPGPRI